MIILKFTKNQGFPLSLEDKFFEKPQGVGQIDPVSRVRVEDKLNVVRQCNIFQMFKQEVYGPD